MADQPTSSSWFKPKPKCRACFDSGMILGEGRVFDGNAARKIEFAYRCTCTAGERHTELRYEPTEPDNVLFGQDD